MEIDTEIFESFMKSVTERLTRLEKMIQMLTALNYRRLC